MRRRHADQLVAEVVARAADGGDLRVLGVGVVDLAVARRDLALQRASVDQRRAGARVHLRHQLGQRLRDDEIHALLLEGIDRALHAEAAAEHLEDALAGQVGVLLRARQGELALDDLLRQHEPGIVVAGGAQVRQRAQRVEAREQRHRQALAGGVDPQRRRTGQDADAVRAPDRREVGDALRIVPHAVGVDDVAAGRLDDAQHAPVDVVGHAGEHVRWAARPGAWASSARTSSWLAPMPPEVTITACAFSAKSPTTVRELARAALDAARLQHIAAHAVDHAAAGRQLIHPMAEAQRHEARLGPLAHARARTAR